MKRYMPAVMLFMITITCSLSSCSDQPSKPKGIDYKARGTHTVELLSEGKFDEVTESFDATMKSVMSPQSLKDAWRNIVEQAGAFKKILRTREEPAGAYKAVIVTTQFAEADIDVRVIYDQDGLIGGLWFAPATETPGHQSIPSYANPQTYTEKDVTVGSGKWKLPGTLTIPSKPGPFPAVVLVHGSGPHDRDETIGPNKPFRDLAWGLASKGIVALRYEKRTKQYQAQMAAVKDITVKEETIDDAVAAVKLLRETKSVDPNRIFVLGHSLGGYLAPRIAQAEPRIYGLIIMAGTTRPLEDVIVDQLEYISSLNGKLGEDDKKKIDEIKRQVENVKNPKLSPSTPASDLPFGVPASYWIDLSGYDPAEVAKNLKQPMLILQGGRDYQVTQADYEGWKKALSSKSDVTFEYYPGFSHLFIEGKGKPAPSDYEKPGHVSVQVIDDIARWVKDQ